MVRKIATCFLAVIFTMPLLVMASSDSAPSPQGNGLATSAPISCPREMPTERPPGALQAGPQSCQDLYNRCVNSCTSTGCVVDVFGCAPYFCLCSCE